MKNQKEVIISHCRLVLLSPVKQQQLITVCEVPESLFCWDAQQRPWTEVRRVASDSLCCWNNSYCATAGAGAQGCQLRGWSCSGSRTSVRAGDGSSCPWHSKGGLSSGSASQISPRPCHSLCKGTAMHIKPCSPSRQDMPWQHLHPLFPVQFLLPSPSFWAAQPCFLSPRHPTAPRPSSAEAGTLRISFIFIYFLSLH